MHCTNCFPPDPGSPAQHPLGEIWVCPKCRREWRLEFDIENLAYWYPVDE
jgi:hypothetical protein